MFKRVKRYVLRTLWWLLPHLFLLLRSFDFRDAFRFFCNYVADLRATSLPFRSIVKAAFLDVQLSFIKYWDWIKSLLFQHRLGYIIRLGFLIFLLYRPTVMELDSFY